MKPSKSGHWICTVRSKEERGARKKSPERWFRKKVQMPGAQKMRSEEHCQVRRNDEVAAQRHRWTYYETIKKISAEGGA